MKLNQRKDLNLNGPGNYRVKNNCIYTRAIEINATRHCNLSCKSCSHSSPIANKSIYDARNIREDLSYLSKYIKCEIIRIVGGEPLLHPEFKEIIKAIRDSQICEKICLVTNGTLLHLMDKEVLSMVNKIEISLYPLQTKVTDNICNVAKELSNMGIEVNILEYKTFREAISKTSSKSNDVIQKIYDTCQIAHFWRCITVDNGMLYRCPQSMIFSEEKNNYEDAIKIRDVLQMNQLLKFLENNTPLNACYSCLGSVGKSFNHTQTRKEDWEKELPQIPEEAIDNEYMEKLQSYAHLSGKCMIRKKINNRNNN